MKKLFLFSALAVSALADSSVSCVPTGLLRSLGLPIPTYAPDYIMFMTNDVVDGKRYSVTITYSLRGPLISTEQVVQANVNGAMAIVNVPDASNVNIYGFSIKEMK